MARSIAALHGSVVGVATIVLDAIRPVAEVYGLESMHHPLPEGLAYYWYGAVISEIWFHLLPVPLLMMLLGRKKEHVFWMLSSFCRIGRIGGSIRTLRWHIAWPALTDG